MRLFAIVPAAGLSRRMGQPKLVIDLLGKPVVRWLLDTLAQSQIETTAVIMRSSDQELQQYVSRPDALAVLPDVDPPDMRTSVEHGLRAIEKQFHPQPGDGWLLIPADHPVLEVSVLLELISAWNRSAADVLVPQHQGRRGHPAFFRWKLASRVSSVPEGSGINWLLKSSDVQVEAVDVRSETVLLDLDTPADFAALRQKMMHRNE
ncbi:MAG: nucleotidyltransferase family protein [Planctomycetaceae bacterium]